MTFAAVGSLIQFQNVGSFSLTPGGVGDLILVEVVSQTAAVTGLSSSNVTWSAMGSEFTGTSVGVSLFCTVWAGKVTSTSTATVTISGGNSAHQDLVGFEYSSTVGGWALDVQGNLDSATNAYPSLTPGHGAGELYFGYSVNSASASAGSTSGYTYAIDSAGNGLCYDVNCANSAQAPTWGAGDTAAKSGIAVLVYETSGTVVLPPQRARRTAARTPALPPARRYRQMLPVPAQLNPPYQFSELAQKRQTWARAMPRRSHVTIVVPPQLNPPYPWAEIRQWRQPRGFFPRRGHQFAPVPAQQAATPNPAFTFQTARHQRVLYQRRGRVFTPVPQQDMLSRVARRTRPLLEFRRGRQAQPVPAQVSVAAPAWVQGHRPPLRAIALLRRRFRQLMPWPQAVAPAFSVGTLTASDAALATLTATQTATGTLATSTASAATLSAADATLATLTAADKRTGGPS